MRGQTVARLLALIAVVSTYGACIPYAVGSTARPTPNRETRFNVATYVLPRAYELQSANSPGRKVGLDLEARRGISDRSDLGMRVTSGSGVVLTYKRRLDGPSYKTGAGIAAQVGGGLINNLGHAEAEATLIASSDEKRLFAGYGGLRYVYTAVVNDYAGSWDDPVYGGFTGVRLGTTDFGLSLELGVFREHHQFDDDHNSTIAVVPSLTFHGDIIGAINRWQERRRGR